MSKIKIIENVMNELHQERVKEATENLKSLYLRARKAKKALKNIQREIIDYMDEMELDETELGEPELDEKDNE